MRTSIITGDDRLAQSLQRYFLFVMGMRLDHHRSGSPRSMTSLFEEVRSVSEFLEHSDNGTAKPSVDSVDIVFVDPCFFDANDKGWTKGVIVLDSDLDPLVVPERKQSKHSENLDAGLDTKFPEPGLIFGHLVLAYPEAHWVFLSKPSGVSDWNAIDLLRLKESLRTILGLYSCNYQPLFDPVALRELVKSNLSERHNHPVQPRPYRAAAIDEERPYVFMHGYLAYKLGCVTHLVTTEEMMKELFKERADGWSEGMTFQDIFLNFPDRASHEHLSDLGKRFRDFPGLDEINEHFFVSVGHKHSESFEANRAFFREQKASGKKIRRIFKPSGGMYNVLEETGLLTRYWDRLEKWIEKTGPKHQCSDKPSSHSAPGRFLVVAESLNNRAEKILEKAETVQECIHGATLALEANELLGFQTPTTALESIALRHQLEVKAECMFYGVGYNIDVKNRLKEIEMEVCAVARWFHRKVKRLSLLSAQMSIITEIARVFRESGQFDEEQACLRRLRDLNRQWYFMNRPWLNPIRPVRWYIEKLIGSFSLFLVVLFVWPFVIGVIAWYLYSSNDVGMLPEYVVNATSGFFGLQDRENWSVWINAVMVTAGFFHLGIFVSHLYTMLARR